MGVELPSVECPEPVEGLWYVYILQCDGGSLYTGIAKDVAERLRTHRVKKGAKMTASSRRVELVYVEGPCGELEAVRRERQIKLWSRAKKIALAGGDFKALRELSRSR